jgi:hypothetical protein
MKRMLFAAAIGAIAQYFLDLEHGRERRRRVVALVGALSPPPGPRETGQEAMARIARQSMARPRLMPRT